jgi:hypothetical protein
MKVQELRDLLKPLTPDTLVIVARDSEGNGVSPLHSVGRAHYRTAPAPFPGELSLADEPGAVPAVILWPTH